MQVTIQSVGVDINSDLETKIQRELQFSLLRVEPHITVISIILNSATYIGDRVLHKANRAVERLFLKA